MKMREAADRLERLTPILPIGTDRMWYQDRHQAGFFRLYVGSDYIDINAHDAKNKTDDELRELISKGLEYATT